MYSISKPRNRKSLLPKTWWLIASGLVVLILVTILTLELTHTIHLFNNKPSATPLNYPNAAQPNTTKDNQTDASPATHSDQATPGQTDKSVTPSTQSTKVNGKTKVVPTIASVDNSNPITIRAFVPGVFENGGTCTAKLTKDNGATVQASSSGFQNASYTTCQPITSPKLTSGTWTLVMYYSSPSAEGLSGSEKVVIK